MKECLQVFLDNYIKLENVEAIAVGGCVGRNFR